MACARATGQRGCLWLAALATLAGVCGCGGSSGSGTQASTPVATTSAARAAAVIDADAICKRLNAELIANLPHTVNPSVVASVSPRNAALERRAVAELSRLHPPASIEREWQAALAYRRTAAHALIELSHVAKAGDKAGMEKLGKYKEQLRKRLREVGEQIGFSSCQTLG